MSKRRALGKGLGALIPDAAGQDDSGPAYFNCPVAEIEPNPYQPRESISPEELEEIARSVTEKGIITPLLVSRTEDGYRLVAGERRWRAAKKAGLERVPVVVREVSETEALELALIENIHRKDLNPIEEARAYQRLLEEAGVTQDALAKRLGKDRSVITNLLRLLSLPSSIQKDVIRGNLQMGHARVLAGIKDRGKQNRLRDRIMKQGLSVRQSEALAHKMKSSTNGQGKTRSEGDTYLSAVSEKLKRSLGTKVEIKRRGRQGRISLYFYSDEELERLLDLLS